MALRILVPAAILSLSLTGCASTIASLSDRGVMSDHFDDVTDANKLKSMSGDRRLVRVVGMENGIVPGEKRFVVCPEPFAGAIIARGSSSGVTIVERASGADATTQSALAVDQRADVVRLYQDATHRWCLLRAQGDIDGKTYVDRITALDALAFAALHPKEEAKAGTSAEAAGKEKKAKK